MLAGHHGRPEVYQQQVCRGSKQASDWHSRLYLFVTCNVPCRRRRGGAGGGARISGEFAGGSADPPEVGSIVEAIVEKVAHFGIFVKMRGFAKSGLVYSSQVITDATGSGLAFEL